MADIQLGIEATLSLLLILSIFYSLHLGRALTSLRRDKDELGRLIQSLDRSSGDARSGIEHLRQTTEVSARQLGKTVDQGKLLRAELVELCKLGEDLATRLEGRSVYQRPSLVSDGDDNTPLMTEVAPPEPTRSVGVKSDAERELLRALRLQRA
ncbi:DUF6468 domain-containing protein [Brytella acorum]|uniref:DUF6468 domain-containing protein n=1 Tax=Brytella acorum TaxID=2959299 RepID=A0AA35Y519_9PROT|nr:DUF6468 domain-containing protein [Brytella acorum]MDF3623536.1 DUF6468 domain-containing protein [Brytella acorum]CAI9121621.1 DUF6468 domain-containing protein [Brytella acorum]